VQKKGKSADWRRHHDPVGEKHRFKAYASIEISSERTGKKFLFAEDF